MTDSLNATMQRLVHNLADAIIKHVNETQPNKPRRDLVYGIVAAVSTSGNTLTLNVSGDTTNVTGVTYLGSYRPTVGDFVAVLHYGHDFLVIGAPGPEGNPPSFHTFAVAPTLSAGDLPGFEAYVPLGTTLKITSIRGRVLAGTVTANLKVNGTVEKTVALSTTSTGIVTVGYALADGDFVELNLASPSGASGLSLTVNMN